MKIWNSDSSPLYFAHLHQACSFLWVLPLLIFLVKAANSGSSHVFPFLFYFSSSSSPFTNFFSFATLRIFQLSHFDLLLNFPWILNKFFFFNGRRVQRGFFNFIFLPNFPLFSYINFWTFVFQVTNLNLFIFMLGLTYYLVFIIYYLYGRRNNNPLCIFVPCRSYAALSPLKVIINQKLVYQHLN